MVLYVLYLLPDHFPFFNCSMVGVVIHSVVRSVNKFGCPEKGRFRTTCSRTTGRVLIPSVVCSGHEYAFP